MSTDGNGHDRQVVGLCHLCRHPAPTGWCTGPVAVVWCNYRARKRIGVDRVSRLLAFAEDVKAANAVGARTPWPWRWFLEQIEQAYVDGLDLPEYWQAYASLRRARRQTRRAAPRVQELLEHLARERTQPWYEETLQFVREWKDGRA
jgi:hypothetical protein